MSETLSRAMEIARSGGNREFVRRALGRLRRLAFETNSAYWYARDITGELPRVIPGGEVRVEFTSPGETLRWIREHGEPWMHNERELRAHASSAHYYPSIRSGGRIIGYVKVATGSVYVHDYRREIQLDDDYAFIYDTYVAPAFRGMKAAPFAVLEVARFLQARGFRRLGCHIPPWNAASMAAYARAGFRREKYVRCIRICGLTVLLTKRSGPWIYPSL